MKAKKLQQNPVYQVGNVTYSQLFENGEKPLTVSESKWNGHTWMYSFKETEMRCGAGYLRPYPFSDINNLFR